MTFPAAAHVAGMARHHAVSYHPGTEANTSDILSYVHNTAGVLVAKDERIGEIFVFQVKAVPAEKVSICTADTYKSRLDEDMPGIHFRDRKIPVLNLVRSGNHHGPHAV